MKEELTLGQKLKFFRTQKGMSQSQLEIESDLSFGTVSRIENGAINPTKETLVKIAKILNLTEKDITYLLELKELTPTKEEVNKVIGEMQPILDRAIFPAYVIDNKFRIWAWNEIIRELFEIPISEARKALGSNLMQVLFLMFNIINKIPKVHLFTILKEQLAIYKQEAGRYYHKEEMRDITKDLQDNKLFQELWANELPYKQYFRTEQFYLKYKGKTLNILIARSIVPIDDRFTLLEYFPQDKETAEVFEKIREEIKKEK